MKDRIGNGICWVKFVVNENTHPQQRREISEGVEGGRRLEGGGAVRRRAVEVVVL